MAAVAAQISPVNQNIQAAVPAQAPASSNNGNLAGTFKKANASQFLSHIQIPQERRITYHQMKDIAMRTAGFLLSFGAIAGFFTLTLLSVLPPLVWLSGSIIMLLCIFVGSFVLFGGHKALKTSLEKIDFQNSEHFKLVLEDVRTLSIDAIHSKYDPKPTCGLFESNKSHQNRLAKFSKDAFDFLFEKGVIDAPTKEKMKEFQKRYEKLEAERKKAPDVMSTQGNKDKRDALKAEFNAYRNATKKA